uniref:Uncharacterized protein n=1 Tax=Arundo donax TaxID=35708 RepID=A0A0A9CJ54_ARUDO
MPNAYQPRSSKARSHLQKRDCSEVRTRNTDVATTGHLLALTILENYQCVRFFL